MRNSFATPLIVSPLPDGRRWKLFHPFTYKLNSAFGKIDVTVPAGFVTDFASIPWVFWSWLPSWGKYGKAAVVHDYLYQKHGVGASKSIILIFNRKQVDGVFLAAMLESGTKPWKARMMFVAVRLFGRRSWKRRK